MNLHKAKKVVIVTERIISKGVCEILDSCGATGYTVIAAGGKGSRNVRSTADRASVVDSFANVKIEAILGKEEIADKILEKVADKYFKNYSGIIYLENVEILRPGKF